MTNKTKNLICLLVASPVVLIVLMGAAARAYDSIVLSQLEQSYAYNSQAVEASHKALCASYTALLNYKKENNIAVTGTESPCF